MSKNYQLTDAQTEIMRAAYEEAKKFEPKMNGLPDTFEEFVAAWINAKINLCIKEMRIYMERVKEAQRFIQTIKAIVGDEEFAELEARAKAEEAKDQIIH